MGRALLHSRAGLAAPGNASAGAAEGYLPRAAEGLLEGSGTDLEGIKEALGRGESWQLAASQETGWQSFLQPQMVYKHRTFAKVCPCQF